MLKVQQVQLEEQEPQGRKVRHDTQGLKGLREVEEPREHKGL